MRSASAVAILSGPVVLSGYLVGAVLVTGMHDDDRPAGPSEWLVEAFVTLAVSTAAWVVIEQVSPGSMFSRIGYFSNQVLAAWQSVALWTGLAVIVGICAPVFRRLPRHAGHGSRPPPCSPCTSRGSSSPRWRRGSPPSRSARSVRIAQVAAIGSLLPTAWLGWVLEWLPAWGMPAGPEATVWAMVLTMVLAARWWHDRPAASPW